MAEKKKSVLEWLPKVVAWVRSLITQSDHAQNNSAAPDFIKNRTHYVISTTYTDEWNQSNVEVGSGSSSPGAYSGTFTVTAGNKYRVIITNGNNSKTYTDIEAVYDSTLNGNLLNKNWSNPMQGAEAQSDAFYILVQSSNVILASVDVYGSNCTVQVSEITENVKKLDRKYLPALNEIDHISSSKSGNVTTVTITETEGATTSFQISDGADGTDGTNGTDGKSAYQVAVDNGYVGTEAQWLASLKGADGVDLGQAAVVQVTGQSQTDLMSQKAVSDEVVYPDVTYANIQDIPNMRNGYTGGNTGGFLVITSNTNFCINDPLDVRNYDTISWKKFATSNISVLLADKSGLYLTKVNGVNVQTISRNDYPDMGYVSLLTAKGQYNNNVSVDFTLSNGHHVRDDVADNSKLLNQIKQSSVRVNQNIVMYEGVRLTDKTIVLMVYKGGAGSHPLYGTIRLIANAVNLFYVKNSSDTTLASFNHGNKTSLSLILTFDDAGNMKLYQNGTLKATVTYDNFPNTDWKLYLEYGETYSHASLINANLDDYISVIENYGWENWFPNASWVDKIGYTFSDVGRGTTSNIINLSTVPQNSLVKVTAVLTNNTSSSATWGFKNQQPYPSGNVTVPAGETVTATKLLDVKTQADLGTFGNNNNANQTASCSGFLVGFLWGLDYRYCHDGGFYNLNKRTYQSSRLSLMENEVVPKVLSSSGVGSAIGQIRVDGSGNIQMYNGTTWKQINNS